ncbi:hypothetical protein BSLG_003889 [Batrachochytrium salamandrivorans]|nr:hypothetical protein BASA81_011810 [Batrachochytrium salamandrivorans]KAJ1341460.1 hypothetical protein BSLG_003889 [Batrachochytrium salamandrivorans]
MDLNTAPPSVVGSVSALLSSPSRTTTTTTTTATATAATVTATSTTTGTDASTNPIADPTSTTTSTDDSTANYRLTPILASSIPPAFVVASPAVGSCSDSSQAPLNTHRSSPTHAPPSPINSSQTLDPPSSFLHAFRHSKAAVVMVVALALFTDMAVYGVVIPTLPQIITVRLGMDPRYLGILMSAYAAGLILVTPFLGIISDRFSNRKIPMILGLFCLILSTLLYAYGQTFAHLFIARMSQGISGGVSWTIGFCMLADVFPRDNLGIVMGGVLTANTLGYIVGPPAGGLLYEYFGEKAPFLLCTALAMVDLAGRLFLRPHIYSFNYSTIVKSPGNDDPTPANEDESQSGIAIEDADDVRQPLLSLPQRSGSEEYGIAPIVSSQQPRKTTMLDLVTDSQILVTLVCVVVSSTVQSGIEPTLPLFLARKFQATPSLVGGLWMLIVIPGMFACTLAGYLSDRFGCKSVMAFGMLLFSISSPLIALGDSIYMLMPGLICFGISGAMALTPAMPEMADFIYARDSGAFGTVYALYNVAYSSGMLIGPIVGSLLYERFDLLFQMQMFGFVLLIFSPIALLFHLKTLKAEERWWCSTSME